MNEDRFRREHGIRADVWLGRPHILYEQGSEGLNAIMVPETHLLELHEGAVEAITHWVDCAPGIAMVRHPVPLSYRLPAIAAELRPEWPIFAKAPTWHDHEQMGPKTREDHEKRRNVIVGNIRTAGFDYANIDTEVYGCGDDHFELDGPPEDFPRVARRHFHVKPAKYVFAPKEKTRVEEPYEPHIHAGWWPEYETQPWLNGLWYRVLGAVTFEDSVRLGYSALDTVEVEERLKAGTRIERLFWHLWNHQQEADRGRNPKPMPEWDEAHQHTLKRTIKDETNPLTRERLDIHPLAARLLDKAKRVYFVIEGCLKADAVLSAILDTDRPESVFSVPSVTLWQAEELKDFALEKLRGKQVIIIPDSDWVTNDDVRTQAFRVRETLRSEEYGAIDARVAAPTPESRACSVHGKAGKRAPMGSKRGVDDFLADGHSLDALQEVDRVPPLEDEVVTWMKSHTKRRGSWEEAAKERDYPVLRLLSIFAREDGTTQVTPHALAEYLGWAATAADPRSAQKQVNRAILSLAGAHIVEPDKSLALQEQRIRNLRRLKRPDLMWKDSPTLTIHPDFRANRPSRPVGSPFESVHAVRT